MSKDIIYVDVDDDITTIIGKVKSAQSKVVALVPPNRIGVLQSAVNLQLLARAAKQNGKHLVLISGNAALVSLAAAAKVPVARTLQSKPELMPVPEINQDDVSDIIDGAELPIGDHAKTIEVNTADEPVSPAIDAAIRDNAAEEPPRTLPSLPVRDGRKPRRIKVPNFDSFRKRLVLGASVAIFIIGFLVWAIVFAPHAKILITARTIDASANTKVTLDPEAKTDLAASSLRAVRQQIKKEASLSFDATGSKTIGEKSKGQVVFKNCETDSAQTVPAGTGISAGGLTYITQEAATVPGAKGFAICTQAGQSEPVSVVAQDIGEDYDAKSGTQFNVADHSNSSMAFYFKAVATTAITGGSKKKITVVSETDMQKATDELTGQNNDGVKKQLTGKFGSGAVAIDQTFSVEQGDIKSVPAVGEEATDGKAKLSGALTFSMLGVEKEEASHFLGAYFAKQLSDKKDQRVYSDGSDKISFVDVARSNGTYAATLVATAKLGPKIDDKAVKSEARGKRYGDVQARLSRVPGVESVDIKFSPFWVSSVPNDDTRISIDFKLNETK